MNAYDFDKTIYKNDSSTDFILFCFKRHPKSLLRLPAIIIKAIKYFVFKKGRKEDFKETAFSVVKYCNILKDTEDFWDKKIKNIKSFYALKKKSDDVIISASPRFLLEPVCKRLKISNLICTEVDSKTGKFYSINCHGDEKVKRFKEVFGDAAIEEFYSDSKSDTPMALISKKAFCVKGDKILPWKY